MTDAIINIVFMFIETIIILIAFPKIVKEDISKNKFKSVSNILFSQWAAMYVFLFPFTSLIMVISLYYFVKFILDIFSIYHLPEHPVINLVQFIYYPFLCWIVLMIVSIKYFGLKKRNNN